MLVFKLNAYNNRDKIRALYDVVFICKNYWNVLPDVLKSGVESSLSYKGLEHFDYLAKTQSNGLIDIKILEDEFSSLYTNLGLL